MEMRNCVAINQKTLQNYPNVEAIPFTIFELGKMGSQTMVMAVVASGDKIITDNKFNIGANFDDACKNLLITIKNKLGTDFIINTF